MQALFDAVFKGLQESSHCTFEEARTGASKGGQAWGSVLALRHEQVDVVAAHEVVRQADDGALQAGLAVVVRRVRAHKAAQLRHLAHACMHMRASSAPLSQGQVLLFIPVCLFPLHAHLRRLSNPLNGVDGGCFHSGLLALGMHKQGDRP